MEAGTSRRPRRRRERGAVLAEVGLVALVLWMLLAALLELGRWLTAAQVLQNVAQATARAMALDDTARAEDDFSTALAPHFDPDWLVLDLDALVACGELGPGPGYAGLDAFFAGLPLVNRLLRPLMMNEDVDANGDAAGWRTPDADRRRLLRYPGALLLRTTPSPSPCASRWTVGIPQAEEGGVRWLPVVEEVAEPGSGGRFPLSQGGIVALRIHYPFHAATWTATRGDADRRESYAGRIAADEPVLELDAATRGGALRAGSGEAFGPYAGAFGLGRQPVLGGVVRPYARVLLGQAAFRREVFVP